MLRAIPVIVVAVASAVMVGWYLDVEILKSIIPGLVTMKFVTALAFFLAGVMAAHEVTGKPSRGVDTICAILGGLIVAIMMASQIGYLTGINLGNYVVPESIDASQTLAPGLPSVGTITAFLLIGIAGWLRVFKCDATRRTMGCATIALGAIACAGYFFQIPALYYYWPDHSTGMALHTAILFVLLGIVYALSRSEDVRRPRWVYIDDSVADLYYLSELAGDDVEMVATSSPDEAMDAVIDSCPDILFVDWRMPEMSGREFATLVHDSCDCNCRIIFLTGMADDIVSGLEMIWKPISATHVELLKRYRRVDDD